MPPLLRRVLVPALLLLLPTVARASDYETEYAKYLQYLKRPSLQMRCRQRYRLARTLDVRALKVLADSYASAEDPREQVQSYLVALCTNNYGAKKEERDVFRAWRKADAAPRDAWLWYRTLVPTVAHEGPDEALAIVRSDRDLFVRMAAAEALATALSPKALDVIPELLGSLPKDPVDKAIVIETCSSCLLSQRDRVKEDAFEEPAKAIIALLDEKGVAERTKSVIARHLGTIFDTPDRFTYSGPWLNALKFARSGGHEARSDAGRYARPGQPTFGGLQASGHRIVYVIDMSDSMLKKLDEDELKEMRRGPVTGAEQPDAHKKRHSPFADEKLVNWRKVKTRFDAAREMLKLSLETLPKDRSFAVICFGDEAALLKSCRGLRKVSPGYVKKVVRELDGIKAGPKTADRPWGTLRGKTNLHGALRRAFDLLGRGFAGPESYVDRHTWMDGADTIFVLSDGDPTWDDWAAEDQKEPHDHAGDPESGKRHDDMPRLTFPGPFSGTWELTDDVRRMNLFRKCEIHCIGLGEANSGFLWDLADCGQGRVKMLGWDD
jgi:hypothetical protein